MQEVVGYEININDLFNSPPKTEDVHNDNNISSVEYDIPAPEENAEEGIYAYITEFSKPVVFFKKYCCGLLAVLILASLVAVSIIVFLVVPAIFHRTVTATTSKIPTTATSTTSIKTTYPPEPGDTSCNPTTNQTFLFAYSNDLSSETVLDSRNQFLNNKHLQKFSYYGSVRLDTSYMYIEVYADVNNFNSTIQNRLPDPTMGFQSSSIGSNVFDVIEKFVTNTKIPICGSIILVLLKRYPDEADTSRLVSLIRYHHTIVHVVTSATPSGGSQPKAMYSVASKTNGMGAFQYYENFELATLLLPIYISPYPVYATTIQVSGSGTKALPDFFPPRRDVYEIVITYQDHVPDNSFRNFNLHYVNPLDSGNFAVDPTFISANWSIGGTLVRTSMNVQEVNYKMTLDYSYFGQDVQNLQIRIYSKIPPSNWLPYSD